MTTTTTTMTTRRMKKDKGRTRRGSHAYADFVATRATTGYKYIEAKADVSHKTCLFGRLDEE